MAPWSHFWERNRFTEGRPQVEALADSPYARGAVTGVGIITAMGGLAELASAIASRGRRRTAPDPPPSPDPE